MFAWFSVYSTLSYPFYDHILMEYILQHRLCFLSNIINHWRIWFLYILCIESISIVFKRSYKIGCWLRLSLKWSRYSCFDQSSGSSSGTVNKFWPAKWHQRSPSHLLLQLKPSNDHEMDIRHMPSYRPELQQSLRNYPMHVDNPTITMRYLDTGRVMLKMGRNPVAPR